MTLFLITAETVCCSQSFEGKIVYRLSVETADPKRTSPALIEMMFNKEDTTCLLYIKGDRYKFVTLDRVTVKPKVINQYDPVSNKIYDYVLQDSTANSVVMQTENPGGALSFVKRKKVGSRTNTKVLGEKCEAINLYFR